MRRALALAARGKCTTQPNPRVGCVLVQHGPEGPEIVGEGWHSRAGEPHAEVFALRMAGERARGADAYVTLEPCAHHGRTPPCADALIAAGVGRVFAAVGDPFEQVAGAGFAKLRAAGIPCQSGLLETEARALSRGFLSRIERRRPFVTLKLAMSLDGRTAMASGESRWITGPAARADVHRLRAEAGAVLTGSDTVLADDPELSVRLPEADAESWRQPDRIVLDSRGRVPASARVWHGAARRFWLTAAAVQAPAGVEVATMPLDADGRLSLPAALAWLATRDVNEVLAECGPTLAGSLLRAGLVDELVVYAAPKLLGSAARGLAELPGLERLVDHIALQFTSAELLGPDLKITARIAGRNG